MKVHKEQTHTTHSFTFGNAISDAQTLEMILEKGMSLFLGQGKSIQTHKANAQLYPATKRHSRYLRKMDN
jgi:hypothetical protein